MMWSFQLTLEISSTWNEKNEEALAIKLSLINCKSVQTYTYIISYDDIGTTHNKNKESSIACIINQLHSREIVIS